MVWEGRLGAKAEANPESVKGRLFGDIRLGDISANYSPTLQPVGAVEWGLEILAVDYFQKCRQPLSHSAVSQCSYDRFSWA